MRLIPISERAMEINLTRRQQEIFEYLRDNEAGFEQPPTLNELCNLLGLSSRGSLHKHIMALVDAELVEPMEGKQRGIRLTQQARMNSNSLPLLGRIAAGVPIEAIEYAEPIEVPEKLRSNGECYVLEVKGDSMIDDGILNGDWVIVEHRNHARNGEVVVALIDGQDATLKRIEQKRNEVILHPANSAMEPLHYEKAQVLIQGVMVGLMRDYR
ncbi:transcriptional repressor LexA [Pseudomonadota bacterium]